VAGVGDGGGAGRKLGFPRDYDRRVHHPRQRPRRLAAIVLFGPLLFPVAKAVGVNEVHYAMVVILAMGIGLFAPPFGIGFFSACAIGRTNPDDSQWRIWPYIGALVISLLGRRRLPGRLQKAVRDHA
jgi:hypothetical protein